MLSPSRVIFPRRLAGPFLSSSSRSRRATRYSSTSSSPPPSSSSSHPHPHRPTTTPPQSRSLVDISLVIAAGALISAGIIWGTSNKKSMGDQNGGGSDEERATFTVPVMTQTGAESTKTLSLLSPAQVAARLKEHEASFAVTRKSNPVFRYDTAAVSSNNPIEDDSCCVILERDATGGKMKGDLMFWGVFDGHSGWQTSRLLSSTLVSYVARELDLVFRKSPVYTSLLPSSSLPSPSTSSTSFWSLLSVSPSQTPPPPIPPSEELDTHTPILHAALKNAFVALDNEITGAPIRLLNERGGAGGKDKTVAGKEQTEALNTLLPALSGSCALLAFLDAGRNKLHVAVTGDSRAVMGTWEPSSTSDSSKGKWIAEALTEDQTAKNMSEVARIKSEHPPDEKDTVVIRGRVLGHLEPSRAFGDARYKWPLGMQEKLLTAFHPGSSKGRPNNYKTPPYVTALPVVTTVDLSKGLAPPTTRQKLASFFPVSSSRLDESTKPTTGAAGTPKAMRFIVLATDGLYDRLTNEEIVSLVGSHLTGLRGTFTRPSVLSHLSSTSSHTSSLTHIPKQEPIRGEGEVFTFEDSNLATHLVRNALGGAKREQVAALLSIPAPLSRRYRDDITVTVILLGEEGAGEASHTGGVRRLEGQDELLLRDVKSKL